MSRLFILLSFATLLISCNSCDPVEMPRNCERDYIFSIPLELKSAKDTFQLGDTIFISFNFSNSIEDEVESESFNSNEVPLNTHFSIARIDTNPASCAGNAFEFIEGSGSLVITQLTGNCLSTRLEFDNQNEFLVCNFGIIVKKVGLFTLGFNSKYFDLIYPKIKNSCKTNSIKVKYISSIIGGDANFEFLALSADELYRQFTLEEFNNSAGFAFFVID